MHVNIRADPNESKLLLPLLPWLSMSNQYLEGVVSAALEKEAKNWRRVKSESAETLYKKCTDSQLCASSSHKHRIQLVHVLVCHRSNVLHVRILIFGASVLISIYFCRYLSRSSVSWSLCVLQSKTSSASSLSCSSTQQLYHLWLR